ncbi:MAG: methionine adenosyltransferase [Candidatus Nitrosothermus koennekii]|nr:MAG: methionine adenosyltransferase [Candidatus Nitrosothermus koennekii]
MRRLLTSESVTEGHPDKVCDQIADTILDEYLKQDPNSRVAIECLTTTDLMVVVGEVTSNGEVDVEKIVRNVLRDIGYTSKEIGIDCNSCKIITSIHEQSPDIARGVVKEEDQGAGDQGLMFGYATNETKELMPLPITLAHKLTMRLSEVRKKKILDWVRPDGKSQVTVEYDNGKPKSVTSIVISTQHDPDVDYDTIKEHVIKDVIEPICNDYITDNTKYYINPTGRFVIGGPAGDSGLTGRKIIVDTYGGVGSHGGGAFSGKDPSKVDRSASYMARYVAKNIVAAGLADKCELQVAYAIGVAEPISLTVNTFNTGKISDEAIEDLIMKNFDLRPASIIRTLKLKRPIYRKTSVYGHFGRNEPEFTWEYTDKADILKSSI